MKNVILYLLTRKARNARDFFFHIQNTIVILLLFFIFVLLNSYVNAEGKQVVVSDDAANVELGSAGAELVITHKNEEGMLVRTLGSREFLRYYRQKPRPTPARNTALATALAIRFV